MGRVNNLYLGWVEVSRGECCCLNHLLLPLVKHAYKSAFDQLIVGINGKMCCKW